MLSAIQRHLRPLMIVILSVVCLSFAFFTSMPSFDRHGSEQVVGKIDGRKVNGEDFREAESASYAMAVLKYGGLPESAEMKQALHVEAWRRLLLLSTARDLNVQTDDQEVVDFLQGRRLFQKEGQFQPDLYERFKQVFLQRNNINTAKFEKMVRDEISIEKVEKVIVSPVQVTPDQIKEAFDQGFSSSVVSWVFFDPKDQIAKATATPVEIETAYKEGINLNPEWRTKEKRQVSFVRFELKPEEQKLTGSAKDDARRKLAETALAFTQGLSNESDKPDQNRFISQAQKQQVLVSTTGFFARDEAPSPLPPSPNFNLAAFRLVPEHPISSVVETDRGFFILKLEQVQPSQPRPLTEARGLVEQEIKKRKALTMTVEAGRAAAEIIKGETDKGVPFAKAAADLHLKVVTLPPIVPADPKLKEDMQLRLVRGIAVSQPLHGVTGFLPTGNGGVVATVVSRQGPETNKYSEFEDQVRQALLKQGRETALGEWLRQRDQSKGTVQPQGLYGQR
jgi:peptidyl-prolyl cis-trans isomerase D